MKYLIELSKCNLQKLEQINANPDWYSRGGQFLKAGEEIVETHGFSEITSCFDHERIARMALKATEDFEYEANADEYGKRMLNSAINNIKH